MPHLMLEYSANVADRPDLRKLLSRFREVLVQTGLFVRDDIKSRARRCDDFVVGDGAEERAFVALELAILEGREDEVKKELAECLFSLVCAAFPKTLATDRSSLTVRVTDIHRASYCRVLGRGEA